jgi:hypothetical protein
MTSLTRTESQIEHEEGVIKAFFLRDKQERFLGFLSNPKNRKKLTQELSHFRWFDQRFVTPLPWKVDPTLKLAERHAQGIDNIVRLLKSKGAQQTCWVISEDVALDGKELNLENALERVIGLDMGTILSCVPARLAIFAGEDETLLLGK